MSVTAYYFIGSTSVKRILRSRIDSTKAMNLRGPIPSRQIGIRCYLNQYPRGLASRVDDPRPSQLDGATSNHTNDPIYELTQVVQGATTTES
jgi:hypothetical protein